MVYPFSGLFVGLVGLFGRVGGVGRVEVPGRSVDDHIGDTVDHRVAVSLVLAHELRGLVVLGQ
jgi:hypothetical protein